MCAAGCDGRRWQKLALNSLITLTAITGRVWGNDVEAYWAEPYGVGRVRLHLETPEDLARWQLGAPLLSSNPRLIHPIATQPGWLHDLREAFRGGDGEVVDIYFLFSGSEPFSLTTTIGTGIVEVTPEEQASKHHRLLNQWWRSCAETTAPLGYAPFAEIYWASVWQRRLPALSPSKLLAAKPNARKLSWIELLDASPQGKVDAFKVWATETPLPDNQFVTVPPEPVLASDAAPMDDPLRLEEAASFVPADCFYVRFGKFSNLLWMLDLLEDRGGEVGRIVTLRSVAAAAGTRVQQQLAVEELPFAEYLGDKLIADAALVGHDFYLNDGAAVGLLLKAKNMMLPVGLQRLRRQIASETGAELTELMVGDTKVSQLMTDDNSIRSFYAKRDSWHFITNSEAMVRRFVELTPGDATTLASDPVFRQARTLQPATDKATDIFLGPKMLQRCCGTRYQLEAARRRRAASELVLVELADLAAGVEGDLPLEGEVVVVQALQAQQLLPSSFGSRTDGSTVLKGEAGWRDSRRGALGFFLPIPDLIVDEATAAELAAVPRRDPTVQPVFARIERSAETDQQVIPLKVKAYAFPENPQRIDLLRLIAGAPTENRLSVDAPMWFQCEAVMTGLRVANAEGNRHVMFGILDKQIAPVDSEVAFAGFAPLLLTAPVFQASWPGPSLLDGVLRPRRARETGLWRGPLGTWRFQAGEVHLQSAHRDVVEFVGPRVSIASEAPSYQARMKVQDIETARLSDWLCSFAEKRSLQAALNNLRVLHDLMQRFGLPPDAAQQLAATLYGGPLVSPLRGQLEVGAWPQGDPRFISTDVELSVDGLQPTAKAISTPAMFRWFKGAEGALNYGTERVSISLELDLGSGT